MKIVKLRSSQAIPPAVRAYKPTRNEIEEFRAALVEYLDLVSKAAHEEKSARYMMNFFQAIFSKKEYVVEQKRPIDFVVRHKKEGSTPIVLFEHKQASNRSEMISLEKPNRKAFHEIVLYYMRERYLGTVSIRNIVICDERKLYIFKSSEFERVFYEDRSFRDQYINWQFKRLTKDSTEFFYDDIVKPFIEKSEATLHVAVIDLSTLAKAPDADLLPTYRLLCRHGLLGIDLENDSNTLNKEFYSELLHIMGLQEQTTGKRSIERVPAGNRNAGSLIEMVAKELESKNAFQTAEYIERYGAKMQERAFRGAVEICLVWINRLLFLKLLEGQLVRFHRGDDDYKFLQTSKIEDFDELGSLFFKVLAIPRKQRERDVAVRYSRIPYLNSALFDRIPLEEIVGVHNLKSSQTIPVYSKTVLRNAQGKRRTGNMRTLDYLFEFLGAYDFGSDADGEVREKGLSIINASVLGLIFEKINGYREGAIFTPGYITMYMSRSVIEAAVVDAFRAHYEKSGGEYVADFAHVRNIVKSSVSPAKIREFNAIIDSLRICDPAVGSGHFLVSCLNELIATKARLGILADANGELVGNYDVSVDNDELIVTNAADGSPFAYRITNGVVPETVRHMQMTMFEEKRKLIENCLFGVDINPNSVRICQLRLWIELLKNTYYDESGDLQTLPNIDINIRAGNSLLSRYDRYTSLSKAFLGKISVTKYKSLVAEYRASPDRTKKASIMREIENVRASLARTASGPASAKLKARIVTLRAQVEAADLLDEDDGAKKKIAQEKLDAAETKLSALERKETFLNAFEWRYEFPEVLDDNGNFKGFDIIIANPPYMRIQDIQATQPRQKGQYVLDYDTAQGAFDLANLFYELADKIARKGRHNNVFILPHKLFTSAHGKPLRSYLMQTRSLKRLTHFGACQVFEDVDTYTCIAHFDDRPVGEFGFRRFNLGDDLRSDIVTHPFELLSYETIEEMSNIGETDRWVFFETKEEAKAFRTLHRNKSTIGNNLTVSVGLQTSRDILYFVEKVAETEDSYTVQVNPGEKSATPPIPTQDYVVEKHLFKPVLKGRGVHRYETPEADLLTFFPYTKTGKLISSNEIKEKYPLTFVFITDYRAAFEAREGGRGRYLKEYYAYIYPKNLTTFDKPKLLAMEICSNHTNVTIDLHSNYHTTKVYNLRRIDRFSPSLELMTGVLNSSLAWWYLKRTGDTLQGDARTFKTDYIAPMPFPHNLNNDIVSTIEQLVSKRYEANELAAKPEAAFELERDIDDEVYRLYGIGDDLRDEVRRLIRWKRQPEEIGSPPLN